MATRRQVNIFINGQQAVSTIKSLSAEKRKINREINQMVIGSDEYNAKIRDLKKVDGVLRDHREKLRGVDSTWQKLSKAGVTQFAALTAGAFTVDAVVSYGKELFRLGTEMEVLTQKAKTVFGDALPQVTRAAEDNAAAMGLTISQYTDAAAAIGDLLIPMGFQREEAAAISTNLVDLSGALSEWTGGQIASADVSKILSKALLGEREELKQLGISIQEADVQARLAEKGLKGLTGELLQQAKAAVTLELITEKSTDAQTTFANNSDTLVRKQAELRAQLQSVTESLATALIPIFHRLIEVALPVVETFADFVQHLLSGEKATGRYSGVLNILTGAFQNAGKFIQFVFALLQKLGTFLLDNFGGAIEFVAVKLAEFQNLIIGAYNEVSDFLNLEVKFTPIDIAEVRKTFADYKKARDESGVDAPIEPKISAPTGPSSFGPTGGSGFDAKAAEKASKDRQKAAVKEQKDLENQLKKLQEITERYQEEARLAQLDEDDRRLEQIRLRYQKEIDAAKELEAQKAEEVQPIIEELYRLQQEALAAAKQEIDDELYQAELDAIDAQLNAELQAAAEADDARLEQLIASNEREQEERERAVQEAIDAEKRKLEGLASIANALGSIVGSALQAAGDEFAKNTAAGKILTTIQIALSTAEGIAKAVAAGAGIPFPANLGAIASGVAAVGSGIAAARAALATAPAVPQRATGGWFNAIGQDDGRQYRARYIGQPNTGMLPNHPVLINSASGGTVLASEGGGAEYFVSHRSLRNPAVLNYVRAIDNIQRHRQYADGGFTLQPAATTTATPPPLPSADASAMEGLAVVLTQLTAILNRGIYARLDDDTVIDVRDRLNQLIDASGGVL